jgi:hypothetical protein
LSAQEYVWFRRAPSASASVGLLVAPLISALAARLALRTLLRGPADAALEST